MGGCFKAKVDVYLHNVYSAINVDTLRNFSRTWGTI